jgi:hypothetical protein
MKSLGPCEMPDRPVNPEYTMSVAVIVFTRPQRSRRMPKMIPPVAQPRIMAVVA